MGIDLLNFLLHFHRVSMHRNIDIRILTFSAKTTSHEFRLNITPVYFRLKLVIDAQVKRQHFASK